MSTPTPRPEAATVSDRDDPPAHRLTTEEVQALILAATHVPTTQAQLERFVAWATAVLTDADLIHLALRGLIEVDVRSRNPDRWIWRKPS